MQNCMQRLRDILLSDISLKDKRELLTLVSALINKKYGSWQEHKLYQEQKQNSCSIRLSAHNKKHSAYYI